MFEQISKDEIERWYLKKLDEDQLEFIDHPATRAFIIADTEKSCCVKFYRNKKYYPLIVWIPKSVMGRAEKSEAAKKVCGQIAQKAAERELVRIKKFQTGCERYAKVLAFAKEHKIKGVRSGLRLETLLNKISEAGLVFEEKDDEEI